MDFKKQETNYTYLFVNGFWYLVNSGQQEPNQGLKIDEDALKNNSIFKTKLFYLDEPCGFAICSVYTVTSIPPLVENVFKQQASNILEKLPYQYIEDIPKDVSLEDYLKQVKAQFRELQEKCALFMREYGLKSY